MTFGVGLSCGKRGTDPDSRAEARVGWDARSGCRRGGGWGKRGQGAGVGVKRWAGPSSEGTVPPLDTDSMRGACQSCTTTPN